MDELEKSWSDVQEKKEGCMCYLTNSAAFADMVNSEIYNGQLMLRPKEVRSVGEYRIGDNYYILKHFNGIIYVISIKSNLKYENTLEYLFESVRQEYLVAEEQVRFTSKKSRRHEVQPTIHILLYLDEMEIKQRPNLSNLSHFYNKKIELNQYNIPISKLHKHRYRLNNDENKAFYWIMHIIFSKGMTMARRWEKLETYEERFCVDETVKNTFEKIVGIKLLKDEKGEKSLISAFETIKNDGIAIGKRESIINLLEEHGEVPEKVKTLIAKESNLSLLKDWLIIAARSQGIYDFCDKSGLSQLLN